MEVWELIRELADIDRKSELSLPIYIEMNGKCVRAESLDVRSIDGKGKEAFIISDVE